MIQVSEEFATPQQLAENAIREVLRTQWAGEPAVRLDSPPGAGKTWVVERLAIQAFARMSERCMVVTQTNEQGFDVARRLCRDYPNFRIWLYVRDNLPIPSFLPSLPNLRITTKIQAVGSGPCVVIVNAAKWSWIQNPFSRFDIQIVDEAFQLADYRFQQIAGLADRFALVGDPGQIVPIIRCEVERWRSDRTGPHVSCPQTLLARYPELLRLSLPVSRRLPPDTVSFVQPAFYPTLPFIALSATADRKLEIGVAGTMPIDRAINLAREGASLVQIEMPSLITGEVDEEATAIIISLINRLFERRARVRDGGQIRALEPGMIGVVCAHVSQVEAVRERMPRNFADIFVETADRFQGLERAVMLVHHPLSGRRDGSAFHLDAGRLSVMLSRHRVACFIITRGGIEDILLRFAPSGNRILGVDNDPEFEGWRANLLIQQRLREQERVLQLR
jgi:hypothetical protein